jgi:UDP-N-acetylglucosamine/UDP-N-acetylgalactosamine diphosphorylase
VPRKVDKDFYAPLDAPSRILKLNLEYIGHLTALQVWYRAVRLARIPAGSEYEHIRIVTQAASELLSVCIDERAERLRHFLEERGIPIPTLLFVNPPCPLKVEPSSPYLDHIEWVKGLSDDNVQIGASWLQSIVESSHAREIA